MGFVGQSLGSVLLWCVSCLAVGATVGFLFGIPRAGLHRADPAPAKEAGSTTVKSASGERDIEVGRPNTNLEEVSDWLTKIIVGLALVNLDTIETRVMAISRNAAAAIHLKSTDAAVSTASALIVGFAVIGFLSGYLYTRLFLQGAFSRANSGMKFSSVLDKELTNIDPAETLPTGQPSVPSTSDRQSAQRVLEAAPSDRPDLVLLPLQELASEFEKERHDMPDFSRERTRKMSEVVSRMNRLALVAKPYVGTLVKSNSPGERLAAVIVMRMAFEPNYIEWLADRLHEESAFIGYQAASALLSRVRVAGPPEKLRIKTAVEAAEQKGIRPEKERDEIVRKIKEEASR